MKKILLSIFALMGITLLESCFINNCGGSEFSSFNWKDLSLITSRIGSDVQLTENQKIRYDSVRFRFNIDEDYISFLPLKSFSSSSLYACDPAPPFSKQRITEIKISSTNIYMTNSKNYNANSDLAEIFDTNNGNTIERFLADQPIYGDFGFIIVAPPKAEQQHEFTFSIKLDDGRTFEKKASVMLTP